MFLSIEENLPLTSIYLHLKYFKTLFILVFFLHVYLCFMNVLGACKKRKGVVSPETRIADSCKFLYEY